MSTIHEVNADVTNAISMINRKKSRPDRALRITGERVIQTGLLQLLIGLCMGRALFLAEFTPFALPFFAVMFVMKRDKLWAVSLGVLFGSFSLSVETGIVTLLAGIFLTLLFRIFRILLSRRLFIAASVAGSVSVSRFMTGLFQSGGIITWEEGMTIAVEGGLAFLFTLVFLSGMKSLVSVRRKKAFMAEEMVAMMVIAAAIATGVVGVTIQGIAVDHVLTRYVVVVAALAAGALVASTVGIVTGLVLCLSSALFVPEVTILAVAGLNGGLLKSGHKTGVAIGLMGATLAMNLVYTGGASIEASLYESGLACLLLVMTPMRLINGIGRHVPGTDCYEEEQLHYARRVRDVTSEKVENFSAMFSTLAESFSCEEKERPQTDGQVMIDETLSRVTERTCQQCFKKDFCWTSYFQRTYDWMSDLAVAENRHPDEIRNVCVKAGHVIQAFDEEQARRESHLHMKWQMQESNQFVSNQLAGIASVMDEFAQELKKETEKHDLQEQRMVESLQDFGVDVDQVDVHDLTAGRIDLDVVLPFREQHGECEKLIAPMLSSVLGETIVVHAKTTLPPPYEGEVVTFRSVKAFKIETGTAHAASGGGLISGDSHAMLQVNAGKYAFAISDGMGSGERANAESEETLKLLRQMLQAGIEEELAIRSVNSLLTVKRTGDMYATVDLVMLDLQTARAKFLKVGSVPSYIKRGRHVKMIEAGNLPLGFVKDLDFDIKEEQLKAGDLVIMMSDGMFEGPRFIENPEQWIKRQITELETQEPQEVADLLMEAAIRTSGEIEDDMTIMVVRVEHYLPKWAAIPPQKRTG